MDVCTKAKSAFEKADLDSSGVLSRDVFFDLLRELCPYLSAKDADELLIAAGSEGDTVEYRKLIDWIFAPDKPNRKGEPGDPLRGISVNGLQNIFVRDVEAAGFTREARVYQIEQDVIRSKGSKVICPCSGLPGASYVNAIHGEDNAGQAAFMLSYTWGYTVGCIVSTLDAFCKRKCFDPKSTYVWICCLCINQHRVKDAQARGELISFEAFEEEFGSRVREIKNILVLSYPWHAPRNITRVWCNFEISVATKMSSAGCRLEIVMPPNEEDDFLDHLFKGTGLERVWRALASIDVEQAQASNPADRICILELINREFKGYAEFNRKVMLKLQAWFTSAAQSQICNTDEVRSAEDRAIASCSVAHMFQKLGKMEAAKSMLFVAEDDLGKAGLGGTRVAASLLTRLGAILWRTGKQNEADACFTRAQKVISSCGMQQTREAAALLLEQGIVHLFHKRLEAARSNYEKATHIFTLTQTGDTADTAELNRCLGQLKRSERDLEGAIVNFEEARRILEQTGTLCTPDGVVLLTNMGNLRRDHGDLPGAASAHTEAYEMADALGILHSLEGAGLLMSMGRVKAALGDYVAAMKFFKGAWEAREALGSMTNTGGALLFTYMAEAEMKLDNRYRAIEYYKEALHIWEANNAADHTQATVCRRHLEEFKA